jgi:predicted dehydrogenase
MANDKMRVAIVGCGNIAERYARDLAVYSEIDLRGVTDLDIARAEKLAAEVGSSVYSSLEAVLDDGAVDLVVNLTIHHAHKEVSTRCLEAGKHVYSEKPLALATADARTLVDLARERGLRLGCSPFTYMGEPQQTAWKCIREGKLGEVRVVYAEVNWGRIESWHPAPGPFYEVGALWDVGVYPLTMLTTIFGPVRRVFAYGKVLHPDRVTSDGHAFHIETPDFVVALVELANGPLVRLTTNFYVGGQTKQSGLELHGDLGSLHISSWHNFDATVGFAEFGEDYKPVPVIPPGPEGVEWGRGVREMVISMLEDRPHRATGEQAAHVVEVLEAITRAMKTNERVEVTSSFSPPRPMDWAV